MMIHEKITELRKKSNWSQEELADKINVSRQAVSKWELGQSVPDLANVIELVKLFSVSTDYLLTDLSMREEKKFIYYPRHEVNKSMTKITALAITLFVLGVIGILIMIAIAILEPMKYMIVFGPTYEGVVAYCYIYPEYFIAMIICAIFVLVALIMFSPLPQIIMNKDQASSDR